MMHTTPSVSKSARRRLRRKWRIFASACLLLLLYAVVIEPRWVQVTRHEVALAQLPPAFDGFTIVHLTDLHYAVGLPDSHFRRVVRLSNAEQPDLIVLTGDLLPRGPRTLPGFIAILKELKATHGVVAVLGNHDMDSRFDLVPALRGAGIPVLENENLAISRAGQQLWVLGVKDVCCDQPHLPDARRGIPADAATILLCHEPDYADHASAYGIGLQLSGHSHGGQGRLPFIGPLTLPPGCRRYPMGRYQVGDTTLYTNRGIGGVGGLGAFLGPPRFLCRPEIAVFRLRGK